MLHFLSKKYSDIFQLWSGLHFVPNYLQGPEFSLIIGANIMAMGQFDLWSWQY